LLGFVLSRRAGEFKIDIQFYLGSVLTCLVCLKEISPNGAIDILKNLAKNQS